MKRFLLLLCLTAAALLWVAPAAWAETSYLDTYWGGDATREYLGSDFRMSRTTLSFAGGNLTIRVYTNWAQAWKDATSSQLIYKTYLEDVFIDFDGYAIPSGTSSLSDNAQDHGYDLPVSQGGSGGGFSQSTTIWDAVIHVDDTTSSGPGTTSGDIYLHEISNVSNTLLSQQTYTGSGSFRKNQETRAVILDDSKYKAAGKWSLFDDGLGGDYLGVQFQLDISGLGYDWSPAAYKYAHTCANDVVFISHAPEPGSALLVFGGLLSGVVAHRRRRRRRMSDIGG